MKMMIPMQNWRNVDAVRCHFGRDSLSENGKLTWHNGDENGDSVMRCCFCCYCCWGWEWWWWWWSVNQSIY